MRTGRKSLWSLAVLICTLSMAASAFGNGYGDALKHIQKAQELIKKKEFKDALRELGDAEEWNPGYGYYAYARYLRGRIHELTGEPEKARQAYQEALKELPNVNYRFVDPAYQVPEAEIQAFLQKQPGKKLSPPRKKRPVPEFFFLAEGDRVELFSNQIYEFGNEHYKPCEFPANPKFKSLLTTKKGDVNEKTTRLTRKQFKNWVAPYCKDKLDFPVYAQGPGWVETIRPEHFLVQGEPGFCGDEPDYRILGAGKPWRDAPLFFTTKPTASKSNGFQSAKSLQQRSGPLETMPSRLPLPLPKDFQKSPFMIIYTYINKGKQATLFLLKSKGGYSFAKETYGQKGEGTWHGLFKLEDGKFEKLEETFESEYCGPNELSLQGTLDYDGDGDLDILIRSSRSQILLERSAVGFRKVSWGQRPCTC